MTALAIDHLSHSQVQTFTACPRKWHYEKVEQVPPERVGAARLFGSAIHDTLAQVNEAALHGERIDAGGVFISTWKQAVAQVAVPIAFGKDGADDLLAKGRGLVTAYVPPTGIIGVEQPFTVEIDPDLPPVQGRIDLIRRDADGDLTITDIKTASSRRLADTHAVEAQLGLYDLAYPAVRHDAIVLGKLKTPTITFQPVVPWPEARLRRHYLEVHAAMVRGVRYAVLGWACEGCAYADRCRQEG